MPQAWKYVITSVSIVFAIMILCADSKKVRAADSPWFTIIGWYNRRGNARVTWTYKILNLLGLAAVNLFFWLI